MTERRSTLAWGVALVAAGTALLLRNAGVVPADIAVWPWAVLAAGVALLAFPGAGGRDLAAPVVLVVGGLFALREFAWLPTHVGLGPIVLIAVGVLLLCGGLYSGQPEQAVTTASLPLDGATRARVKLSYGAGTLRVAGGAALGLIYDGTFAGGMRHEARRVDDLLDVSVRHASDAVTLFGWRRPLDWQLRLSDAVPIDLEIGTGASRVELDLSQLRVRSLKVETGASDVDVVLPAHGGCSVDIEAGAADVRVRVPDGVAASVRTSTALASVDIDPARFPRVNGTHRSPEYDTATDRTEIHIEGGLASFSVR